jgi:hypothetical protein
MILALRASSPFTWFVLGTLELEKHFGNIFSVSKLGVTDGGVPCLLAAWRANDLGFTGLPLTCDNNRASKRNVRARLLQALADNHQRDIYAYSAVVHLVTTARTTVRHVENRKVIATCSLGSLFEVQIFQERDIIDTAWRSWFSFV